MSNSTSSAIVARVNVVIDSYLLKIKNQNWKLNLFVFVCVAVRSLVGECWGYSRKCQSSSLGSNVLVGNGPLSASIYTL